MSIAYYLLLFFFLLYTVCLREKRHPFYVCDNLHVVRYNRIFPKLLSGQWFCPGRVRSRVKVIYLLTRYCDPVSDRTTEWYSSCFYAGNTWTHCAKSALSEHTYPSVTV